MDDSKIADPSWPLKIGDEEYQATMLTDKAYGSLDNYIKATYIENAFKRANAISDEKTKDEIKQFALSQSVHVGWYTHEGINIMSTQEGVLHLGFHMCLKRHPTLKYSDFVKEAQKSFLPAIENILMADRRLNYTQIDDKESRGTLTENDKSVEG